jgi:hypothetical protein
MCNFGNRACLMCAWFKETPRISDDIVNNIKLLVHTTLSIYQITNSNDIVEISYY